MIKATARKIKNDYHGVLLVEIEGSGVRYSIRCRTRRLTRENALLDAKQEAGRWAETGWADPAGF